MTQRADTGKRAVVIGAGPAGLTAALELLEKTDITPVVFEQSDSLGGLATTVNYKGNRIDIGGHRFFSKSDWVMDWWLRILPLQRLTEGEHRISYQGKSRLVRTSGEGPDPAVDDLVMLLRQRRSRIYWQRQFFDYPLQLTVDTLRTLGPARVVRIFFSYARSMLRPIRPEKNLEQFFINRFGRELYQTFFKAYTEKVWGVACRDISAAWGAQRVKGLNVRKAVWDVWRKWWSRGEGLEQKKTETSLISQFLYPKYGPGQMWDEVGRRVGERGGAIRLGWRVERLVVKNESVVAVEVVDVATGRRQVVEADYVLSTMPVQGLVDALDVKVPREVREISDGLQYRDFITVGLLLKRLLVHEADGSPLRDNWIYIQEPEVKVGRLQIFNNWSPYMVKDPDTTVWVGLEYFCDAGDALWQLSDKEMVDSGVAELAQIGMVDPADVLDATVIRVPKTYPAYFGTYDRFAVLREWVDRFDNLWLLGRNGMHRYNNQDHSMLTAKVAVEQIAEGRVDKAPVWEVNVEPEYHESASGTTRR